MEPDLILTAADLRTLETRPAQMPVDDAVFHLTGSAVIDCLQGILTNDVVRPGTDALVWGAVLTPKGMIIADAWVRRRGDEAWFIVPAAARAAIQLLFTRSFPPRLARARDVSDTIAVRWLTGGAPDGVPDADLVRPSGLAPFSALLLTEHADRDQAHLEAAGWHSGPSSWAGALKLLGGWPALGREIDEKTLPQEVRFDELEGVRYDKGCYTGQETVARLHFRGHANRRLVGLEWESGDALSDASVRSAEREVGTVRTLARLGDTLLGLALLRREVSVGDEVVAGGVPAIVIELPFRDASRATA